MKSGVANSKSRLLDLLRSLSFARRRVILASGKESDFFIDCKQTVLTGEGHVLVGHVLQDAIASFGPCDAVAGVELGGCPLASAVAMISTQNGKPLDALYVRKEVKDHGSKRLIEGGTRLTSGARSVLLEDVVTTGGSTLKAAAKVREAGFHLAGVVALVDRLEGGSDAIEGVGIPFRAVFSRKDFMADGV